MVCFTSMSDSAHNLASEDRPVAPLALAEHQTPWSFLEIYFHYIIVWRNLSILTDEFDKTGDSPLPDSPEAFSLGIRSGCSSSLEWYHFILLVSLRSLCWSSAEMSIDVSIVSWVQNRLLAPCFIGGWKINITWVAIVLSWGNKMMMGFKNFKQFFYTMLGCSE